VKKVCDEIIFVNSFPFHRLRNCVSGIAVVCGLDCVRMEFAFELATSKHAGRVFLFAAGTAEDRRVWMAKLGQVLRCHFVCSSFVLDYFVRSVKDECLENVVIVPQYDTVIYVQ